MLPSGHLPSLRGGSRRDWCTSGRLAAAPKLAGSGQKVLALEDLVASTKRRHSHSHSDLTEVTTIQRSMREWDPMGERIDGPVSAHQARFTGVTRKVLERLPLPGDNRELVVVEVTYPPGGVAPLHRHPVGGALYIIEGVAESAYGGDDPRQYRAGETLQDRADIPHTLFRNCDPERPLRFLTIYVLEPERSYTMEL
jgi:quercetin dioxygenase-like cupin family protein